MYSIVLTGGGTAGHIIPSITLLPKLKQKFDKIYYIGSSDGAEKSICQQHGVTFYSVTCVKLRRSLTPKNLLIPIKLIKGVNEAKKLLKELKPSVVFSKGGYVAMPVVIASKALKIPVVSHESDLTPGLANKLLQNKSVVTLTAFKETAKLFNNGVHAGLPIRKNLDGYDKIKALKEFNFSGNKPVLLVFGGSLGAQKINSVLTDATDELLKDFDVLHLTGKKNTGFIKKTGYTPLPYLDDMSKAYSIASVIVSRCGANSAFEILSLNKPCVFIPLSKKASRGDQIKNAEYFSKQGYADTLQEELLTPETLINAIKTAYKKGRRSNTAPVVDATEKIVDILYRVANNSYYI